MTENPERVVIQLPLSVDGVAAIATGLTNVWPDAQCILDTPSQLVIELSGPEVEAES
jgi:hypothetical protein